MIKYLKVICNRDDLAKSKVRGGVVSANAAFPLSVVSSEPTALDIIILVGNNIVWIGVSRNC